MIVCPKLPPKETVDLLIFGVCGQIEPFLKSCTGKVFFDCVDLPEGEFSSHKRLLKKYISLADEVSVTSKAIQDSIPGSALIPNACFPEDWKDSSPILFGKIAGYIGAIASWTDTRMIEQVAQIRKDYQFVFIGQKIGRPYIPNGVRFIESKPYHQLPGYVASFTVGLAPFVKSEMTRAVNPVKVYEYLAAGVPVVATPLPEYQRMKFPVYTADNAKDMAELLDVNPDRESLVAWAEGNTWIHRAEEFLRKGGFNV